jgi:hypothetical protein
MGQDPWELISSPIEDAFRDVIQKAQHSLFLCSPYIKDYGTDIVIANSHVRELELLTNISLANITNESLDLSALLKLWDKFDMRVSSLGKLHAKIYIADNCHALITSANLTRGGLKENYEYGVLLNDRELVEHLRADMQRFFSLGNIFERHAVEDIAREADELKALQKQADNTLEARKLRQALQDKADLLQTTLLRNRVRGQTINAIFADTILYLLATKGAMSTVELHPLIQDIHPDICDDTIDRVINGQHFGKKWKHLVRNAQQTLMNQGKIVLYQGKWYLTGSRT